MAKQSGMERVGSPVDLGEMAKAGQKSLATVAQIHTRMFRDSLRFQAELLDFARRRLGADIAAQDRLMRCSTPDAAARVVTEFCATAARDYSDEATGLMKLCAGMAAEATETGLAAAKDQGDTAP